MKADEIRSRFLEFFKARGHRVVASASLIPADDPTVLFTPAGMNQFKNLFLGIGAQEYTRAASSQKCLRALDIDKVGRSASHHTFFEMLGNFSFGDYFKQEAIGWAWEFLLQELKIPEGRLHVSVYQDDEESFGIWRDRIGLPEHRIRRFGAGDNFWPPNVQADGPNGPCGPCSEIFYDTGEEFGCGEPTCGVHCDCKRYVEIWNLVFTQYERKPDGSLAPLKSKNIDTGMGLERIAAVMQNVRSNFEIDLFAPILHAIADLTGRSYDGAGESGARIRRVADHLRACVFCVADGIGPANDGRGYVERRLIRRALRDGMQLGIEIPFLHSLVGSVVDRMSAGYPELKGAAAHVSDVLRAEEERFQSTLRLGTERLQEAVGRMSASPDPKILSGADAFRLYDTYGLPVDIITDILREKGMAVDIAGFEREMEIQRQTARGASPMAGDIFAAGRWAALAPFSAKTQFMGYAKETCEARILAILPGLTGAVKLVAQAQTGQDAVVLLDKTPFYAEGGGQVGDTGRFRWQGGRARVADTQQTAGMILHFVKVEEGALNVGRRLTAEIDSIRRASIRRHHTATHLLHAALRELLGPDATQAGSLVAADRLRFDFQHNGPLGADQVARVEELVSEQVLADLPVKSVEMGMEAAKAKGAMSLFGEKYGDQVRVIEVRRFSMELCGGTHVARTGQIGPVVVVSQSSVSAGVRRIEAVAGFVALRRIQSERESLKKISALLNATSEELLKKIEDLRQEDKKLAKELERLRRGQAVASVDEIVGRAERVNGISFVSHELEGSIDDLRSFLDRLKSKAADAVAVLGGRSQDRADLLVYCSPAAVARGVSAGQIAQAAAKVLGGGGGGKPESAQAGGKDPAKLPDAIQAAVAAAKSLLAAKSGGAA